MKSFEDHYYDLKAEHQKLLEEVARLKAELNKPCTCGSGAHPRHCDKHPEYYEQHVREINYDWAQQDKIAELEAELESAREALQDQWESNHAEHCSNRLPCDNKNGCQWPKPEALASREKEPPRFEVDYGQGPADEHGVPMRGLDTYKIDGKIVSKEEFRERYEQFRASREKE